MRMNCKSFREKQSRYYPSVYLERLRRKTNILTQGCRSPGRVCNGESLEYETVSDHSTVSFGVFASWHTLCLVRDTVDYENA
jgi:hypothetical protein